MIYDNFEIHARPFFSNVLCPKHGKNLIELDNGWFKKCWYCKDCKYPYDLVMRKMANVNKENLKKLLLESEIQP